MARNLTIKDLTTEMIRRRKDQIASHDNPIFRSVPATGVRGDQPAGDAWKNLLKDESLLRTNDRLNKASGFVASPDTSNMPTDPNDPFSTPKWVLFKKIQRALKDLSPKEYERRKQNGTLPNFGMDMEDLQYYLEDLEAGKAPDRGHPDTHDYLQQELMIGREPNKEDAPYRGAPRPGDPDYTPPPSFPGQDIPKLAHLTHELPTGWSMPPGTHDPREHKQYDPSGTPIYDPMDGGENIPWDMRPLPELISQVNYGKPSELDKLLGPHQGQGGSLRHLNEKDRRDLLIRGTKV